MQNRGLKSSYFYSAMGMGVIALTGITTGVLSSRALGVQGRGELTALLLLPGLVGRIGNVGMLQAVGYLDSPARNRSERIAGAALVASLIAGLVLLLILLPLRSLLLPNLTPAMMLPAAICLLFIPLNFVYTVLLGSEIAAGNFRSYNLLQSATAVGQAVLMLMFWRLGRASSATFGSAVVVAVLLVLLARTRMLGTLVEAGRPTVFRVKEVLAKAWQFTQPELAGLALLRCDALLLARMVSNEALGLYTVALAIAFGQALTANPMAQVCFQSTSSTADHEAAVDILAKQFRILQILFLGLAALSIAIAPALIRIGFGDRFAGSTHAAVILILSMAAWSCSQVLEGGLRGMDLTRLCSWSNLLGLAVLLALATLLVSKFGIEGMAVAMLAGQSTSLGSKLFWLRQRTNCRISSFWAFSYDGLEEVSQLCKRQLEHAIVRLRKREAVPAGSV